MTDLVARTEENARLRAALDATRDGAGGLVLLAGEAGIGGGRLAAEAAGGFDGLVLTGAALPGSPPYAPLVAALRSLLRAEPDALAGGGPLGAHLNLILPELGPAPPATDRATLFEAVCRALGRLAERRPVLAVLDDLHWSDQATLELLSALACQLGQMRVAVVAAYRSDGLPRDHGLRRLRNELRRAGCLEEITLEPLGAEDIGTLVARVLGEPPSPALLQMLHERTQGIPFFVEELTQALRVSGALRAGSRGLELEATEDVPVPETVRDAVLVTTAELSPAGRDAAETAAVAGASFGLELVAGLTSPGGVAELAERGLVVEDGDGGARFRHALARDALYTDVPWLRRRALHRELAAALEGRAAPPAEVAAHWLGGHEEERARTALLAAAARSQAGHAHRDAADAARGALDLWPHNVDEAGRLDALARYARAAELAGDLADAARAWRELADLRARAGDADGVADAHRRLAAVHDLRGGREAAFAARRVAADQLTAGGRPGEAAVERLAMANQMRLAARHREAVALAAQAGAEAAAAGRADLRARALGLEGMATAKQGDYDAGVTTVRTALASALEHGFTGVAAELYQRLSVALYDASNYARAEEALDTALDLCRGTGQADTESACVTCLAYVLRERGDWDRAVEVCRGLIDEGTAVFVAEGLVGAIEGPRGRLVPPRRHLASCHAVATRVRHYNMRLDATTGLARVALAEGDVAEASERARAIIALWEESDDHHYATNALRWSAQLFAVHGDERGAHACVEALGRIAADTGYPDAFAALGHAIGESVMAAGDADAAGGEDSRAARHAKA